MTSSWVDRCPLGHASLQSRKGAYYYCRSCECCWHGEPLDARKTEFPAPGRRRVAGGTPKLATDGGQHINQTLTEAGRKRKEAVLGLATLLIAVVGGTLIGVLVAL